MAPLAPLAVGSGSGLLRFIRYAFMPNHLGYCGGRSSEVLLEHGSEGRADGREGIIPEAHDPWVVEGPLDGIEGVDEDALPRGGAPD